jgi:hypothetical protein
MCECRPFLRHRGDTDLQIWPHLLHRLWIKRDGQTMPVAVPHQRVIIFFAHSGQIYRTYLKKIQLSSVVDVCFGSPASIANAVQNVRFSNRPVEVKRFQTIHDCGVDVAHGLVLLSGIGTEAVPSWDSRTRWNNLYRGLAYGAGPSGHPNSPHPSSREGHHSTA